MNSIIFRNQISWLDRRQPWVRLISFLVTVVLATCQQWSARDLAWSFWLTGLLLGLIYILVYQVANSLSQDQNGKQHFGVRLGQALGSLAGLLFVLLLAYLIFAVFLDVIFAFVAWDMAGAEMSPFFAAVPAVISHIIARSWSFLVVSGISLLPTYIQDALTVNFTDFSKPIFARDLLRMIVLIFLLVPLTLAQLGVFALYAVLFVYFLPLDSLRQIGGQLRTRLRFPASRS